MAQSVPLCSGAGEAVLHATLLCKYNDKSVYIDRPGTHSSNIVKSQYS